MLEYSRIEPINQRTERHSEYLAVSLTVSGTLMLRNIWQLLTLSVKNETWFLFIEIFEIYEHVGALFMILNMTNPRSSNVGGPVAVAFQLDY